MFYGTAEAICMNLNIYYEYVLGNSKTTLLNSSHSKRVRTKSLHESFIPYVANGDIMKGFFRLISLDRWVVWNSGLDQLRLHSYIVESRASASSDNKRLRDRERARGIQRKARMPLLGRGPL